MSFYDLGPYFYQLPGDIIQLRKVITLSGVVILMFILANARSFNSAAEISLTLQSLYQFQVN